MTEPLPVHGVDISHHQDTLSLDLVGAKTRGLRWMYHKATEGNSFRDSAYASRRAEAAAADLPFGGYHFARADVSGGGTQADAFLIAADPQPGDMRPALDLETDEGLSLAQLRTWAGNFVSRIEQAAGVKPLVYTPFDLGSAVDGCVIWRPRYNNTNTPPVLPFDIWQFSNGVLGVPNFLEGIGHVDLNTMRKGLTMADLTIPQEEADMTPEELRTELAAFKKGLLADLGDGRLSTDPDNPDALSWSLERYEFGHRKLAQQIIANTQALLADTTSLLNKPVVIDAAALEAALPAAIVAALREIVNG